MAINDNITVSKGSYSVEIWTTNIAENIKNKLRLIPAITGKANQDAGPKTPKVIDLLDLTRTYHIEGYITATSSKTAKQVKDDLRIIAMGAYQKGGNVTMHYEDEDFEGKIENLVISKIINDDVVGSGYSEKDSAEYRITFDFVIADDS